MLNDKKFILFNYISCNDDSHYTALTLPFMKREPIELPPIVSVELIQITDKTNIPFAPKARKIIEESQKKRKKE